MASISGQRIVFTGKLEGMTRAEAQAKAESLGAIVGSAVNAETDLLVIGAGGGSSLKAALKHGVKVVNEKQWLAIADGANVKKAGKEAAGKNAAKKKVAKTDSKKKAPKVSGNVAADATKQVRRRLTIAASNKVSARTTKKRATKEARSASSESREKRSRLVARRTSTKPGARMLAGRETAELGESARNPAAWRRLYLAEAAKLIDDLGSDAARARGATIGGRGPCRVTGQSSGTDMDVRWYYLATRDEVIGYVIHSKAWATYGWETSEAFLRDVVESSGVFSRYKDFDVESRPHWEQFLNVSSLEGDAEFQAMLEDDYGGSLEEYLESEASNACSEPGVSDSRLVEAGGESALIESRFMADDVALYDVTLHWGDRTSDLFTTEMPKQAAGHKGRRIHQFGSVEESISAAITKIRDALA